MLVFRTSNEIRSSFRFQNIWPQKFRLPQSKHMSRWSHQDKQISTLSTVLWQSCLVWSLNVRIFKTNMRAWNEMIYNNMIRNKYAKTLKYRDYYYFKYCRSIWNNYYCNENHTWMPQRETNKQEVNCNLGNSNTVLPAWSTFMNWFIPQPSITYIIDMSQALLFIHRYLLKSYS